MKYILSLLVAFGAWHALNFVSANYFSLAIDGHISEGVIWGTSVAVGLFSLAKMD